MRAQESVKFQNITATSAPVGSNTPSNHTFPLQGGLYSVAAVAATWGTAELDRVGPDGSTLLDTQTAPMSANGGFTVYLPPGSYQFTVAGATALYASIDRIPLD